MLMHLWLKDPHGGFRDDGADDAPLPAVVFLVESVEQIGGTLA